MPPSCPAGQHQPTLSTAFASAMSTRKTAALLNAAASSPPAVRSARCSASIPSVSPTTDTNSRSREACPFLKRAEEPASTTRAFNSGGGGCSDDDDEADVLLGELLFGSNGKQGGHPSSPRCLSPVASPASLGITAPAPAVTTASGAAPPRLGPSRPRPHLTQTTLDLGQEQLTIAKRCPLCDMLYTAENDEDAALHKRFCREVRLRRRDGSPCDVSSLCTCASRSRRARMQAAATSPACLARPAAAAVRMLEELSGTLVKDASSPLPANTTATVRRSGPRRGERRARGTAKAKYVTAGTPNSAADATGSLCTCVFRPLAPSSSSSSPDLSSPLGVFRLSFNGCGVSDSNGGCTALRLLEMLGFTPVVLRAAAEGLAAPKTVLSADSCETARAAPTVKDGAASIVHVVCVVDTVLRLLLCAVVGEPRRREQDPELCVEQRADGATVCRTRRHFTHGDVSGLWVCSPVELRTSRKVWEKRTAAQFASTRQMVERFFGACAGGGASSLAQSQAAHVTDKAQERCQQAAGVAILTLAQYLVYGSSLCPWRQLSYSHTALAAGECLGVDFVQQSLAVASSSCPTGATPVRAVGVEDTQSLYTHSDGDEDGSSSDGGDRNESNRIRVEW
ncbi:hypothetical protein, conserved [Leishmania tarentolae]|uniref:N-acetyltransferase ESCO zinc-finger domain-containing protein n=1 Tax=Leishmania tarentolae TaxID=5689 RepID=A0A640K7J3_LEITA|nr:hypothetical protein, conserved [Leishmania tarentolae]